MLYPGRDSSVTQCSLCDRFAAVAAAARGSLPGLEPVNQAGGVKIIDTLGVSAVLAIQSGGPKPFNMLANLVLSGCK
jgi:hypothetical protein